MNPVGFGTTFFLFFLLSEDENAARVIQDDLYDTSKYDKFVQIWMPLLNPEQSLLCEEIYSAVHSPMGSNCQKIHILNSPGGYGKTLVVKVIAARIRSEG